MFRTRLLLSLLFCFIQTIGIGSMGKQLTPKYMVCCILNTHPPKKQSKDQDISQKNALSAAGGSRVTVSQARFCCLFVSICLLLQDCSSCRRAKARAIKQPSCCPAVNMQRGGRGVAEKRQTHKNASTCAPHSTPARAHYTILNSSVGTKTNACLQFLPLEEIS